ncbi:MAG: MFS transporter [Chloroflexi bacterium]|nr:MFS transporter [Chloroflexota bacterium]
MTILNRARQAYYGWRILAASSIVGAIGGGLINYGFSVFFLPISQSLELNRTSTSLVFSLSRSEGAIEGPIAGYLIDRLGPRRVLFVAGVMMGIGYLLLARVNSFVTFLVVYMGIISLGFNAGVMHAPMAAANSWFVRKRGLAIGMLSAFFGLGGAIVPPLLSLAIRNFGWQTAAFLAGLVVLGVIIPCSFVFRRSPESMGLLPDGDSDRISANTEQKQTPAPTQVDFTLSEALHTPTFWVLTLAICLRLAAFIGITAHFVPIMVWKGITEAEGAMLLGAIALLTVPLRFFLGWAGDRIPRSYIIAASCAIGALALFLLLYAKPGWQLWAFVVLLTFPESIGPISWSLIADFYGRRRFASIRGAMTAFTGVAGAVMPVVAGFLFDTTQSYETTIWIMLVILVLAVVVFAVLRPPTHPTRVDNSPPSSM